jgi:hypothetical protein
MLTAVQPSQAFLSLAEPHGILAEHGELTLVVVTNKNPGWVPDDESSEEFLAESMSTR